MHRNLHYAILSELMDAERIPAFDLDAFFLASRSEPFDPNCDYDFCPLADVADHVASLEIDADLLTSMDRLRIFPGTALQHQIFPQWDGEDGYFDVPTLDGIEACANLTQLSHQLLPPGKVSDIAAVSTLQNLADISFSGGTFNTLDPMLACSSLKVARFTVSNIIDNAQNREVLRTLQLRGCNLEFRACRGLVL